MKNITLSADEPLIKKATEYDDLMGRLQNSCESSGPYTRDEMNER